MKTKNTKYALMKSFLALLLCFSMLIGATFAWFTDTATVAVNKIQSGKLDVDLVDASNNTLVGQTLEFQKDTKNFADEKILWEPGCTYELPEVYVLNKGNLALKYQIVVNGITGSAKLLEAIEWTVTYDGTEIDLDEFNALEPKLVSKAEADADTTGAKIYKSKAIVIQGHMKESAGNEYQDLSVDGIGITVYATQIEHEFDSFTRDYDKDSSFNISVNEPAWEGGSAEGNLAATGDTVLEIKEDSDTLAKVTIPEGTTLEVEGVALTSDDTLQLTVEPTDEPGLGIDVEDGNSVTSYDVSLMKITTVTGEDPVTTDLSSISAPVTVELYIGTVDLVNFYHKNSKMTEVDALTDLAEGKYFYDAESGMITFMTSSFSPFTSVYKFNGGLGTEEYPYLIANVEQMQAISNEEYEAFYQIDDGITAIDCTDWESVSLYGSFDGNGVTFENLSAPLFGYAYGEEEGGTVTLKNFTVDVSPNANFGTHRGAVLCYMWWSNVVMNNVDVTGTMIGYGVASYIGMGLGGKEEPLKVTFTDCISSADLIGFGEYAAGFIGYPNLGDKYDGTGPISVELNNSYFTGSMLSPANYYYSNSPSNYKRYAAFTDNSTNKADYVTGFDADAAGSNKVALGGTYLGASQILPKTPVSAEGIDVGDVLSVTAAEGAQYCDVLLIVGPNGANESGNFIGAYGKEALTVADGKFTTKTLKKFNVHVNDASHAAGISGSDLYITYAGGGKTYGSYQALFVQYESAEKTNCVGVNYINLK